MITISEKWNVSKKKDSKSYEGREYFTYSLGGWENYCISPDMEQEAVRIARIMTAHDLTNPIILSVREMFCALADIETDECVNLNLGVHDKRILAAFKAMKRQLSKIELLGAL